MAIITKKNEIRYLNSLESLTVFLKENLGKFKQKRLFELHFKTMLLSINDIISGGIINSLTENFIEMENLIALNYVISKETDNDDELIKTETGYFLTDFNFNEVYFINEINEMGIQRYEFDIFYLQKGSVKHNFFKTANIGEIELETKTLKLLPFLNYLKKN